MQCLQFAKDKNPFDAKRMPRVKLVILDFDGTLTKVDEEAKRFVDGYKISIAQRLGISIEALARHWDHAEKEIAANPNKHGWKYNGKIVAPAYADPYILCKVICHILFDQRGLAMDPTERDIILEAMFTENYPKTTIVFKEGVNEFLLFLRKITEVCIATNSHTDAVLRKLAHLDSIHSSDHAVIPVHGNARKYVISDDWTVVPEVLAVDGFDRPIFLRRENYAQVIEGIRAGLDLNYNEILVVGDIFELDLVLPMALGMQICLVPREWTPVQERQIVESYEHGFIIQNLGSL